MGKDIHLTIFDEYKQIKATPLQILKAETCRSRIFLLP